MSSAPFAVGVDSVVFLESADVIPHVPAIVGGIGLTDVLAWVSIGAFFAAFLLHWQSGPDAARRIGAVAWLLFGVFWLTMVPYYYYDVQSPLQTVLALAALPLCAYTGYLLFAGRQSLLLLTKAVGIMGLIYLPAETIPFVRAWLIETTAAQTHYGMELLGHSPGLSEGVNGYESRFDFDPNETVTGRTTYIVMACTGLGSMAIFGGLIASVTAPLKRKAAAFALSIGVIWALNLTRNVFIGLASPWGWFQQDWIVSFMTTYLGAEADRVSYLVAHNYVSQSLSVVALIGITYLVVRILPEVLAPLEEVLYVLSGNEYDLFEALGKDEYRPDKHNTGTAAD
ncbi:archaeosortase A [Natronobacterium gregoryi]|uniref:Archaeosortase A n=2 Tax=Natronobacterium gregoryi TaxID=44930 RepID=L0AGG0_NATGS|nr:archaeosortase A [Natronobacterium gregoryi]AFZ72140.1 archaeosortase A, PGF-CTERM-specific [Natronobacterium gregoryi SP2]ELY62830.1 Exosortase EpsH-like protein [Natronobacterium gregoryi SP2]PLK19286.1 archaeosortase A [Natronobacterium gregoryi SP2]SFJ54503.1 archaeosortase A, PGF-CTERM-specific [Natronobacterium gregoryi]